MLMCAPAAGIPVSVCFCVVKKSAPPSMPKDHRKRSSRTATSADLLEERASWALSALFPMAVRARMERAGVEMRILPPNERTKRAGRAGERKESHGKPRARGLHRGAKLRTRGRVSGYGLWAM